MKRTLLHARELDGVRGCAALSVLVLHLVNTVTLSARAPLSPGWKLIDRAANLGTFGVDVFFVLSGFLITSLLLADRASPSKRYHVLWTDM